MTCRLGLAINIRSCIFETGCAQHATQPFVTHGPFAYTIAIQSSGWDGARCKTMVSKFASQPMSWNQMYQHVSKVYSSLPSHTYQMRPTKHVFPERSECFCNPVSSGGSVARSTHNGFKKVECENTVVVVQ